MDANGAKPVCRMCGGEVEDPSGTICSGCTCHAMINMVIPIRYYQKKESYYRGNATVLPPTGIAALDRPGLRIYRVAHFRGRADTGYAQRRGSAGSSGGTADTQYYGPGEE